MRISDTVSLAQVLAAHAEAHGEYATGKLSYGAFLDDDRRANLTGAYLTGANLTGANLTGANLTDADLARANLTDANLTGAYLTGAYLTDADLARANLTDAYLARANLTGAYLTGANLTGANLTGAYLTGANLTGADLTGADLPTVVKVENIDERILAAIESGGALEMSSWHTCETTHCRAGWAVALAGEGGRVLEDIYGSAAAGALIYAASRPGKPIPNFYAGNEAAMESIKADAADASEKVGA
jgi:hypothetical protein